MRGGAPLSGLTLCPGLSLRGGGGILSAPSPAEGPVEGAVCGRHPKCPACASCGLVSGGFPPGSTARWSPNARGVAHGDQCCAVPFTGEKSPSAGGCGRIVTVAVQRARGLGGAGCQPGAASTQGDLGPGGRGGSLSDSQSERPGATGPHPSLCDDRALPLLREDDPQSHDQAEIVRREGRCALRGTQGAPHEPGPRGRGTRLSSKGPVA